MINKHKKHIFFLILLILFFLISTCSKRNNYEIKLNYGNWRSIEASSSIAEFIIEIGYGYPVKKVETSHSRLRDTFKNGEIDLITEAWTQNLGELFNKDLKEGSIISLGSIVESAPQFWMIPLWFAEEYKIRTVWDMKEHWKLFETQEKSGKGTFYAGVEGWNMERINILKLKTYGLDKYYDVVINRNPETFDNVYIRSQEQNEPVFGYYWAPSALMGLYDWYILEEPEYEDSIWDNIQKEIDKDQLEAIDRVCAYEDIPLIKVARSDLAKKAPDVVEMLKKMSFSLPDLNKIVAWMQQNNVSGDNDLIARYYLQNYENVWKTWVTEDAYLKIKMELKE